MRHIFSFFAIIFLSVFCVAVISDAASGARKDLPIRDMGGQTIKTRYFSVLVPDGWGMPFPPQEKDNVFTAIFGNMKEDLTITIKIVKANVPVKILAAQTLGNMRRKGINGATLIEKDSFYKSYLSGKMSGLIMFGESGGYDSVITMVGHGLNSANQLLNNIQTQYPTLVPTSLY